MNKSFPVSFASLAALLLAGSALAQTIPGSNPSGVDADRVDRTDIFQIFEQLRQRDLLEFAAHLHRVAVFALVAQIAARLDAGALAQKGNGEAFAERVVVDAHRRGVENFDRVRVVVRVEDRDREVIAVCDFDRTHDERILRRKELMTALVPRTHLVKNAVGYEAVEDLAEGGNRRQRLRAIAAGINDLQ